MDLNIKVVDTEKCKLFLRFVEDLPNKPKALQESFEEILKTGEASPIDTFLSGMSVMGKKLENLEDHPLERITSSPLGVFQSGLLLGYHMALASSDPLFADILRAATDRTKNVRSIFSATRKDT